MDIEEIPPAVPDERFNTNSLGYCLVRTSNLCRSVPATAQVPGAKQGNLLRTAYLACFIKERYPSLRRYFRKPNIGTITRAYECPFAKIKCRSSTWYYMTAAVHYRGRHQRYRQGYIPRYSRFWRTYASPMYLIDAEAGR